MAQKRRLGAVERQQRLSAVFRGFDATYPDARCALEHRNPLELLVATILSAQCTDERVNIVTRGLFRKYRKPGDYVAVAPEVLQEDIRPTGFFRNKTKSIQGACRMIIDEFDGRVPESMEELLRLPGVARKTANVVLGVSFNKAEGVVVDTHVFRVARRLELSASDTPEKVERDLMRLIPRDRWISFSHQAIHHGRRTCKARRPLCPVCPVESVCRTKEKVLVSPSSPPPAGRERQSKTP
jgi:endonuclease-3